MDSIRARASGSSRVGIGGMVLFRERWKGAPSYCHVLQA